MCEHKELPNRSPGKNCQVSFWLRQSLVLTRFNQHLEALGNILEEGSTAGSVSGWDLCCCSPRCTSWIPRYHETTIFCHQFPTCPNCMQLLLIALPGEHRQGVLGNLVKCLAYTVVVGTYRGSTKVFGRLGVRAGPWAFFPYFP